MEPAPGNTQFISHLKLDSEDSADGCQDLDGFYCYFKALTLLYNVNQDLELCYAVRPTKPSKSEIKGLTALKKICLMFLKSHSPSIKKEVLESSSFKALESVFIVRVCSHSILFYQTNTPFNKHQKSKVYP